MKFIKKHKVKNQSKSLNKKRNLKKTIEKRYNILIKIIMTLIILLFVTLFNIQIINQDTYKSKIIELTKTLIEGSTAPRGRIYDRNFQLIVDNIPTKVIYYKKNTSITNKEEIKLAYTLSTLIELDYSKLTTLNIKIFWIKSNPDLAYNKITKEEYEDLKNRKITSEEIENLKLDRINNQDLNYTDTDLKAIYIYTLMNKGYSYSEKIIKSENVTDEEYAIISIKANELNGINTRLDWNRSYVYDSVFKSIIGTVSGESGIPFELKEYYLKEGYTLNDRVGISYLEYYYDKYLKGTKNTYQIEANGNQTLVSTGSRGNDLVLTIDIELQKQVEEILEEELIKAKLEPNTENYNHSFVIITDPNNGEILAMAGKQIVYNAGNYQIYDYTTGIINEAVTVGSVVKGASHIVGYNNNALVIGEQRYDNCVKLASTNLKCSWKYLGLLNDITALKYSSNTYQFYTAMKVAGINYVYNGGLKVNEQIFNIYRTTFNEFGLGVKTGIDLPNESVGLIGKNDSSGLLLDFTIGQYDNYTPIQLSQYISTIASGGNRLKPHLLKSVYSSSSNLTNKILEQNTVILNTVNTENQYLNRVKEGFIEVMKTGGTGSGYIDKIYNPAGKTGTSQSFVDTNNDGKIDTETVTTTFVGYAPYDNPKVTFTVISPNVYTYNKNSTYQSYVNKRISKKISDAYFKIYNK
ncbi:MAG: peptidoglycan D,D-transpeptidase FtsI family protein [Bacilli bacterium]